MLVVGVGTGLELGLLPRTATVTGIDLSAPMLRIARERVTRRALTHVKALRVMDAAALEFADNRFDVALAPYVMSVVPEPRRVLDEMWRVARPGGQLVVMNHFAAERGARAKIEALMEKIGRLARLASAIPLCRGRRLDSRARRGGTARAARTPAVRAVHAAADWQERLNSGREAQTSGFLRRRETPGTLRRESAGEAVKSVHSILPSAWALAAALSVAASVASAQTTPAPAVAPTPSGVVKPSPTPPAAVAAPTVMAPLDQLMSIGPLPDITQGSPSAAITIIEYASMTCSHCAAFHETTWPELKSKYIDSGRAKFILREFPLDPLATAGFMLARCAGPDKRNQYVDQLFAQQKSWAFVDRPVEPLLALVKTLGMSQTEFETCLRNQDLYEQVNQSRERAAEAFNIDSTPTFFVNGRKLTASWRSRISTSCWSRWSNEAATSLRALRSNPGAVGRDRWIASSQALLAMTGGGRQFCFAIRPGGHSASENERAAPMKFERLRLAGFKSFCDPTEFKIEPGLTGIVGPNGCGKSNLVEAMRWVMGENSYKNMRASGMDDVIFSGSGRRPSRNIAEVGLVLDNSDRRAPAAFNDSETIEVTRRIERESGSTYRVNGREARARDVQLLFADASTGARSPAMVRQGQIGEIIAAKPQARRLILEEAAGVSGLHSRRHEAELR